MSRAIIEDNFKCDTIVLVAVRGYLAVLVFWALSVNQHYSIDLE